MDIRSLLTARDVALDAGLRQRPPILTPEDALGQIAASMRLVGDSADDESPGDLDRDIAQPPGASPDDMPGLGGAGIIDDAVGSLSAWIRSVAGSLRLDDRSAYQAPGPL
jgi:hypothetical protein